VAVGPLGGFWPKPGGSVDRVEGIIIETFVILCQYNSQIHRVPAGRMVTNKQTFKKLDFSKKSKNSIFGQFLLNHVFFKLVDGAPVTYFKFNVFGIYML
jgi:hypothetical protein